MRTIQVRKRFYSLGQANAAVNAQTSNGEAPLHLAFGNGSTPLPRLICPHCGIKPLGSDP